MGLLVAGTKYRGEFEERLKKLMEEIKQNDEIILVSTLKSCVGFWREPQQSVHNMNGLRAACFCCLVLGLQVEVQLPLYTSCWSVKEVALVLEC